MACKLPVLTYRPIPGYGKANAAAMAEAGVARLVRTRNELGPTLVELIDGLRGQRQAGGCDGAGRKPRRGELV
jgi:hypothetical protein